MTLDAVNQMDRETFVATLGWAFEDSPWVAERTWARRPFAGVEALHQAMVDVVAEALPDEQLALIRAHPDLGTRARISRASSGEQARVGLAHLTFEEYQHLHCLNTAYRGKFGFPFIYAVKGRTRQDILNALEQRLASDPEAEHATALTQIYRIARNRLEELFMHDFASGKKQNYYGKADVIAYRLHRDGRTAPGALPVFGANVTLLIYGNAFWPTYETGDNTGLIATDSMKNFIQRETLNFTGHDLESYCRFLAGLFLETYPHVEGAQISATAIPYQPIVAGNVAFAPGGPEVATARLELRRSGAALRTVELRSGIQGFRLLRLGGSAFHGFVRDQYTTLPDIHNRPLHMWLGLDWLYTEPGAGYSGGAVTAQVLRVVQEIFHGFESGSIQQIIYQIGRDMLARIPEIAEVTLEGQNRTWDTVAESGDTLGVYTDARPPYGCLGLTLRR